MKKLYDVFGVTYRSDLTLVNIDLKRHFIEDINKPLRFNKTYKSWLDDFHYIPFTDKFYIETSINPDNLPQVLVNAVRRQSEAIVSRIISTDELIELTYSVIPRQIINPTLFDKQVIYQMLCELLFDNGKVTISEILEKYEANKMVEDLLIRHQETFDTFHFEKFTQVFTSLKSSKDGQIKIKN